MRAVLLAAAGSIAAIAIPAAPAQAERWTDSGFTAAAGVSVHRSGPSTHQGAFRGGHHDGDHDGDRDRRRHRRGDVFVGPWGWSDGDWAYYNNRSWNSDSYNDWWHDRPDRAYPRWVASNRDCERMWQGGGVWRCGW